MEDIGNKYSSKITTYIKSIDEEKEKMEKLRAAVAEFDNYQNLMRKQNRYDFDDMILRTIHALEKHDNLRYTLQEKYQFILLDEFQDTNKLQYAWLCLFAGPHASVFAVVSCPARKKVMTSSRSALSSASSLPS
mgnify:CR=1 FL=1